MSPYGPHGWIVKPSPFTQADGEPVLGLRRGDQTVRLTGTITAEHLTPEDREAFLEASVLRGVVTLSDGSRHEVEFRAPAGPPGLGS